jgi:beta-lactamase regulating signal transducer with metallopeptidase domain
MLLQGLSLSSLVTDALVRAKFWLLLLIAALLAYVHFSLQRQIDSLFAEAGGTVSGEVASRIAALRQRRKRLASVCMFVVLTAAMLGVQVWSPFPLWLTAVLVVAIALFTWRAYSSVTPFGWA